MRRLRVVPGLLLVVIAAGPAGAAPSSSPATAPGSTSTLRLDGIGPLKLGMTRTAAVKTGWLSHRGTGCPLGGPPLPITYRLRGAAAPKGLSGTAEFDGGKLTNLSLDKGARTEAGVVVGTTTLATMAARYRGLGYRVKTDRSTVFGGTFVTVTKGTRSVIAGFGSGKLVTLLGLPLIATCD